jgi:hypothetical protein
MRASLSIAHLDEFRAPCGIPTTSGVNMFLYNLIYRNSSSPK